MRTKSVKPKPMSDEEFAALMAQINKPKSNDEKRFLKLGWQILEAKYRYYRLDAPILQDYEYDMLEREYDDLAEKLGVPPTASDMVGFDITRPSCSLAADRVDGRNEPKDPSVQQDHETMDPATNRRE